MGGCCNGNCAFNFPCGHGAVRISRPGFVQSHVCKRRRPGHTTESICQKRNLVPQIRARAGEDAENDNEDHQRRVKQEHAEMIENHSQIPGIPPLGPTPSELTGFHGWREKDDSYWRDLKEREVSFRAPSTYAPEDLDSPPQPLDRNGKPANYSAAVNYDHELDEWVPTSAEEEERLRNPAPDKDPYFVKEALPGEQHTTLYPDRPAIDRDDTAESREMCNIGGLEFSEPLIRDLSPHRRKRLNLGPDGWRVVHLGTSSAVPTLKRNVSSTAVLMNSQGRGEDGPSMFLIDAGENTDMRLTQCDWCMTHGFRWIRAIFITHLHGDHIYGLPMLLSTIGEYAQYRRRRAVENGEDGSDLVIRIYGPYGTRGFVRSSLYWTNPVGVRFSVAELVPRDTDFKGHSPGEGNAVGEIFVVEDGTKITRGSGSDWSKDSPPPHPEEVRVEDIHADEDGLWHVWESEEGGVITEVVAAPLKHRMPCFGYVFRERQVQSSGSGCHGDIAMPFLNGHRTTQNGTVAQNRHSSPAFEIDTEKARELGVHGTQYRVLRSGRAVVVSKTGIVVRPQDVCKARKARPVTTPDAEVDLHAGGESIPSSYRRKVTILGDTCESSAIAAAAMDSDLLVHEATFTESLKDKAKIAMHSTARMAGRFGKQIRARKVALTHFSSRYEYFQEVLIGDEIGREAELTIPGDSFLGEGDVGLPEEEASDDEDLANPNILVREALSGYGNQKGNIVAAYDFMEHDIVPLVLEKGQEVSDSEKEAILQSRLKQ